MYRSAVASVKTGWMVPRVGVGLDLIGSDSAAVRRSDVTAFGLALASDSGLPDAGLRLDVKVRTIMRDGRTVGEERNERKEFSDMAVGSNSQCVKSYVSHKK